MLHLPIRSILVAPRTFALIPSILYMIIAAFAIIYGFVKRRVRRELRQEREEEED